MEEKKRPVTLMIAALALSFCANTYASVNSLLQVISASFPDVPMSTIMLISTLPSVMAMIGSLVIGAIVGKKISYKASGIIASALSLGFGIVPVFASNITVILVSRAVVGFAAGMFAMRNAYIVEAFEGKQRDSLLGLDVTVANIAGVLLGPIVGILGEVSWQTAFWVYLLFAIPLLTSLFLLKEPEKNEAPAAEGEAKPKSKIVITPAIWIFFIFTFFATLTLYPMLSGMATVMDARGLGGPALAGTCLSLYTGGGVLAGLLFGPVANKIGGRWMLLYSCVLVIIGQTGTVFAQNLIVMMVFTAIAGWGYCSIIPAIMTRVPGVADPNNIPLSTTIVMAAIQGAMFFSSYWIDLCAFFPMGGYPIEKSWYVCVISYIVLAVICIFWNPDKKKN